MISELVIHNSKLNTGSLSKVCCLPRTTILNQNAHRGSVGITSFYKAIITLEVHKNVLLRRWKSEVKSKNYLAMMQAIKVSLHPKENGFSGVPHR